jgi:hypothetical protein
VAISNKKKDLNNQFKSKPLNSRKMQDEVNEDDDVVLLGEKAATAAGEGGKAAEMVAWLRSLGYQQYEALLVQAGFDSLRAAQHLDNEALQQVHLPTLWLSTLLLARPIHSLISTTNHSAVWCRWGIGEC